MKELNYFLVDVFTDKPFGGNQLAVFPDGQGIAGALMQRIASELRLSETTFILPPANPENDCQVRIFTPAQELPMAGHPTIGTAFVLLQRALIKPQHDNYFMFEEGVGAIRVDFQDQLITMNQLLPKFGKKFTDIKALAAMLSVDEEQLDRTAPAQIVSCGFPTFIVPVRDLAAIKQIKLRLDLWEKYLADFETQQVFVFTTETENPQATVHSRFFAPALGIPEDPATGAASGPLGCYLLTYGFVKKEKTLTSIVSEQGIEIGRPSMIYMSIGVEQNEIVSVRVGGRCVFMGEGKFYISDADL